MLENLDASNADMIYVCSTAERILFAERKLWLKLKVKCESSTYSLFWE